MFTTTYDTDKGVYKGKDTPATDVYNKDICKYPYVSCQVNSFSADWQ